MLFLDIFENSIVQLLTKAFSFIKIVDEEVIPCVIEITQAGETLKLDDSLNKRVNLAIVIVLKNFLCSIFFTVLENMSF